MMKGDWNAVMSELAIVAAVSFSHMSMPNHWLPYALVSVGQKWSLGKTLLITFLGALGHVLSTMLVIMVLSGLGGALLSHDAYRTLSSSFLALTGTYYLFTYVVRRQRGACCGNEDASVKKDLVPTDAPAINIVKKDRDVAGNLEPPSNAGDRAAALALVTVTTLSPCVGSMPVLLAMLAPPLDVIRVLLASTVLLMVTSGAMMLFVAFSFLGAARFDFGRFRRHERLVLGVSLILLSAFTFFLMSHRGGHNHVHQHDHDQHGVDAMLGDVMRQGSNHLSGRKGGCH